MTPTWIAYFADVSPLWDVFLKATVLLFLAWTFDRLLRRRNPRWRVLLWRGVAVGLLCLPALGPVMPQFQIPVSVTAQPPSMQTPPTGDVAPSMRSGFDSGMLEEKAAGETISRHAAVPNKPSFDVVAIVSTYFVPLLAGLWFLVSAWLVGRAWKNTRKLRNILRSASPAPEQVQRIFQQVVSDFGSNPSLALRCSSDIRSPMLAGISRPVILIPQSTLEEHSNEDLRGILAHELAHLRSNDPLWNRLLQIVSIIGWFHPLIWRVRSVHAAACEEVCDAVAADYLGDAEQYSGTLARVALNLIDRRPLQVGIPMARKPEIRTRLEILKHTIYSSPLRRRWAALSVLCGVAVLAGIGGLKFTHADQKENKVIKVLFEGKVQFPADPSRARYRPMISVFPAGLDQQKQRAQQTRFAHTAERDGRYEFTEELAVGDYTVTVKSGGGMVSEKGQTTVDIPVRIDSDTDRVNLDVDLRHGGAALQIHHPGFYVVILRTWDQDSKRWIQKAKHRGTQYHHGDEEIIERSDTHLLENIPPGRYDIAAIRQFGDTVLVRRRQMELEEGQTATCRFDVNEGKASIEGRIAGFDGESSDVVVVLREPGAGPIGQAQAYEMCTWDSVAVLRGKDIHEDGTYHAEGLPAGRYTATAAQFPAQRRQYGVPLRQTSKEIELKDSETVEVGFDLAEADRKKILGTEPFTKGASLQFPEDRSLGVIFVRDEADNEYENVGWERLADAKGLVAIPAGKEVRLDVSKDGAKDLSPLKNLDPDGLDALSLWQTKVGAEALKQIAHLTGLEELDARETHLTDDGARDLLALESLKRLDIGDTHVGDEGVAHLVKLPTLESLSMQGAPISDEALKSVSQMKSLQYVAVGDTAITDKGLAHLRNMTNLKGLALSDNVITDVGMEHIATLANLEWLTLGESYITDEGLKRLYRLKSLRQLSLHADTLSQKSVAELEAQLPLLQTVAIRGRR